MLRHYTALDRVLIECHQGLATLFSTIAPKRANPAEKMQEAVLTDRERRHSIGYLRVDHTGEVCAQALYRGQMLVSRSEDTHQILEKACSEEVDHLAWTHKRLRELEGRRSCLNPYWYVHSFLIGLVAGLAGDRWSLGFVEETEKQVSVHLQQHIEDLPMADKKSRCIAEQMKKDEMHHGATAASAGASALPEPVKKIMALQARVMTTLAYYL